MHEQNIRSQIANIDTVLREYRKSIARADQYGFETAATNMRRRKLVLEQKREELVSSLSN